MPKKRKKDQPPEKWTAPILGYPIFDKDGKIVEHEELAGVNPGARNDQYRMSGLGFSNPGSSKPAHPAVLVR